MQHTTSTLPALMLTGFSLLGLAACSSPSGIGDAKELIESCGDNPINAYIAFDASGSGRDNGLDAPRVGAMKDSLASVAACGGTAKVVAFTGSSASTVTLFEGRIELRGATNQAKARRLGKAVDAVGEQVTGSYTDAVATLDQDGSDIVAQLRLAAEWASQTDEGQLHVLLLTDGLQNTGVTLAQIVHSPEDAASSFAVPDLSGSEVTFSGIGQVAQDAPATEVVDAVKTFYNTLCTRTGADRCEVVTEAAGAAS
ncbi:hypothetical protein ACWZJV_05430 [Nocardioides sp. WG-D5]